MTGVQVVIIKKEPLQYLEEECISGLFLPGSAFSSASIGVIEPGVTPPHHYHARPQSGVEIIFVYQGAFELVTGEGARENFDVDQDGPIYIQVPSGMQASMKNSGQNQVKFFSVFAPPFEIGEINFIGHRELDALSPDEAH